MATKKQHETFNKQVQDLVNGLGAKESGRGTYKYIIETKAGLLYVTTHEPSDTDIFGVYCKFENIDTAKEALGFWDCNRLNLSSGKWNFMDYDPKDLLLIFSTSLKRIL